VPPPDPLAPLVTVIQVVLLTAVHPHALVVVTVTEPEPPPAAYAAVVGEIVYAQAGTPACEIVTVWPPTLMVPVRPFDPVFAATL
jgi:hypothetical protein